MVAGLFVLIQALQQHGVVAILASQLQALQARAPAMADSIIGVVLAFACNLFNNLPAGLLGAATLDHVAAPAPLRAAAMIGIDLGPNLSVSGSLATLLWLTTLKREGVQVGAWTLSETGRAGDAGQPAGGPAAAVGAVMSAPRTLDRAHPCLRRSAAS